MRKLNFLILLILFSSCLSSCKKKDKEKHNNSNKTKLYDAGDVIFDLFMDKNDMLWIATSQDGLYTYNGEKFINFNKSNGLCGNEVSSIKQDKNGNIWCGTENGLCKVKENNSIAFSLPAYNKKSDWLSKYYPLLNPTAARKILIDSKGHIWIATDCAGVHKFENENFKTYLQEHGNLMPDSMYHNSVSTLVEDANNNIWIGSFSHGGISKYYDEEIIHYPLPDGIGDGMISSIYIDSKNTIWVGTRNNGIYTYRENSFKPLHENQKEKIPMAKFFEDSKGTFWMSSYARNGVYILENEKFIPFKAENSEKLVDVFCINEDSFGNIWFGGRYGLLYKYDGNKLEDYTYHKH